MRCLILSDSVALPREAPEIVAYEQTWVELVREQIPSLIVHQVSIGGATIDQLLRQFPYHRMFKPDFILIQCGIVDCSPRAITANEDILINSNRLTRNIARIVLPCVKTRLRKFRNIQHTRLKDFEICLNEFNKISAQVFAIEILEADANYETINPGITHNIRRYNESIRTIFRDRYISVAGIGPQHLMSDFHHLNFSGHQALANLVTIFLKERVLQGLKTG
jgi:lysophospholipase L1-like esterase